MDPVVDEWEIQRPTTSSPPPAEMPATPVRETPAPTPESGRTPRAPTPAPSPKLDRLFLHRRGQLTWDQMTGFRGGPQRLGHRLQFWALTAALIDGLLLLSMSSFFLLAFAAIVKNPVTDVLKIALALGAWRLFLVFLAGLSWIYLVGTRLLVGYTVGEWACDLRLGQPSQRSHRSYPFKVIFRSTLILATGAVPLKALSFLLGSDLAGILSRIKIISLR